MKKIYLITNSIKKRYHVELTSKIFGKNLLQKKIILLLISISIISCGRDDEPIQKEPDTPNYVKIIKGEEYISEQDTIIFNDHTIEINQQFFNQIEELNENTVVLKDVFDPKELQEGDVLFFTSETIDNNSIENDKTNTNKKFSKLLFYSRKIISVTRKAKKVILKTANAKLPDVFKTLNIKDDFEIDHEDVKSKNSKVEIDIDENNNITYSYILFDKDKDYKTLLDQCRVKGKITNLNVDFTSNLNSSSESFLKEGMELNQHLKYNHEISLQWGIDVDIDDILDKTKKGKKFTGLPYQMNQTINWYTIGLKSNKLRKIFKFIPRLHFQTRYKLDIEAIAKYTYSKVIDHKAQIKLRPLHPSKKLTMSYNINKSIFNHEIALAGTIEGDISVLGFDIGMTLPQFKSKKENYASIVFEPINIRPKLAFKAYSNLNETCIERTGHIDVASQIVFRSRLDGLFGGVFPEVVVEKKILDGEYHSWPLTPYKKCLNSTSSKVSYPESVNYGQVKTNSSKTLEIPIKNVGEKPIKINNITVSHSVFNITSAKSITITPNQTYKLKVKFNPTQQKTYAGILQVHAKVDSEEKDYFEIPLSGEGVNTTPNEAIIHLEGYLNFPETLVGAYNTKSLSISNTGNKDLIISKIQFPNAVFSADWQSGTIKPNKSKTVTIKFTPTQIKSYSGDILVSSNANSGSNKISVTGDGIQNTEIQPNIIFANDFKIDDDDSGGSKGNDNGVAEAGEEIELKVKLKNTGTAKATKVKAILSTNDNDITITDEKESYGTIEAGKTKWNFDFDFTITDNCPTKTVDFTLDITAEEGSWQQHFSLNIKGESEGGNAISITPADDDCDAPLMQINQEYEVSINTSNYELAPPIDGESYKGGNVRGFWLSFYVPSGSNVKNVKIYDVSDNFDPVMGTRTNCAYTNYLPDITTSNYYSYSNQNGGGKNETFKNNFVGDSGSDNDGVYYVRIYHYNGNETPKISFKIKVE